MKYITFKNIGVAPIFQINVYKKKTDPLKLYF